MARAAALLKTATPTAIGIKKTATPATDIQRVGGAMLEELARVIAQKTIDNIGEIMTRNEMSIAIEAELSKLPKVGPPQELYRVSTVAKMFDVTTGTIWNYVKCGILPKPAKLSANIVVFTAKDVYEAVARIRAGKFTEGGTNE